MSKFKDKLIDRLLGWIPDNRIKMEAETRAEGRLKIPSGKIKRSSTIFVPQTHRDWINAIAAATADEPELAPLAELYKNILLDGHLRATIDNRIHRVLRSRFLIRNANGDENDQLAKLLQRPWFEHFIREAMMSIFTGVKVIELFDINKELELERITSIPMEYLRPDKHMVLYEPYGTQGYPYDKPPYNRFYIQIGEDRDLGLLAQLAPLVLAKKLSMGSWLDYIEKYGIAPLFITTDNPTTKRQEELFKMAQEFFSNSFVVLRNGERVEVGKVPSTDTYNVFDAMIKRINSEISKVILGQDATTTNKDSKGTYGSLKVMQEVANDRHESDKLFIQYIINKKLLPLLANLSSKYTGFADAVFEWDQSENLDNGTYLDRVIRLKQAGFEIDPDAVAERTGIPIIGIQAPEGPNPDGEKKKITANVHSYYQDILDCPDCAPVIAEPVANISKYTKILLRIAKDLFKKGLKDFYDPELHVKIFDDLSNAAELGYGGNWIKFDPAHSPTVKLLQKNLFFFAAGKTMAQLKEMNELLVDNKGRIRSWDDFKKQVLKLNKTYNLRYLQAEYQTAKASAQAARKWNEALETADTYPNLEYTTAKDDRVRDSHAKLDGVIRPINDGFWDTYYPPNGWRCRCSVRPSKDEPTPVNKIPPVPVHKHFMHNVGKTGRIFDEKHPYFKYINECDDTQTPDASFKKCVKKLKLLFEYAKLKYPLYRVIYTSKNGAKVRASIWAKFANDYKINKEKAIYAASSGYNFDLPPYVNIQKHKNIDFIYIENKKRFFVEGYFNDTYKKADKYIKAAFNDKYRISNQLAKKESYLYLSIKQTDIELAARKLNGEFKFWRYNKGVFVEIDKKVVLIKKEDKYNTILDKMLKATRR